MRKALGRVKRAMVGVAHDVLLERLGRKPKGGTVIGASRDRRDIEAFEIGAGGIRVLFVSAIHGNEVGTARVAQRLMTWLRAEPAYLEAFTFSVVPVLNPDGFAHARRKPDYRNGGLVGRFNAFSVDLNRNFPVRSFKMHSTWGRGRRYAEKVNVYCGDSGGSEPETKALIAHVEAFDPKAYVSFHNAAGDVMGNDIPLAQKLTDAFSEGSGYRRETLADWSALEQTGTAKEWCEKRGLAYVEVEGRYRWGADWVNHQKGIRAMLDALLTEREH